MRTSYMVKAMFGPTLQGEGSSAGTVVKFLRFAGCNRWSGLEKDRAASTCSFCDTDFRGGEKMTADEILTQLNQITGPKRVVITGGEPTLQINAHVLQTLKQDGYEIHLETNGSNPLGTLFQYLDHVTISPKQVLSETKLERATDIKILYPPPRPEITLESFSSFTAEHKFLQPTTAPDGSTTVRETIAKLYLNPEWRLSLQTHKIVGVE